MLVKNDDALEVTIVVVIEPEKESGLQVIGSYLLVSDSRELLWRQFYREDPSGHWESIAAFIANLIPLHSV